MDGTKVEANASKYSFVWAKNAKRYQEQVQAKVAELLETIEQINAAEDAEYGENDLPERGGSKLLDAEQLEAKINELNERLRQKAQAEKAEEPEPPQETNEVSEADPVETAPPRQRRGRRRATSANSATSRKLSSWPKGSNS